MSGYTLSHRDKWKHPVFRNLLEAGIWAWMCDAAAWKDTQIRFNGELIELKRGQLATSRRFISEGFCIGEQVTRTFLENLEKEQMINQQPTRKATIITICNYEQYQKIELSTNPQTNQQPTHSQPAANPNKKETKEKKERKEATARAEDLKVEQIMPWLKQKQAEGQYIGYDPKHVLEQLIDYCQATGRTYKDYLAAYRNAFAWERCRPQAQQHTQTRKEPMRRNAEQWKP
jgi:hypothetical protein